MQALRFPGAVLVVVGVCGTAWGNAFVRGGYWRLGDADPGAIAGQIGNDPTQDSFGDNLDLSRIGSPRYSSDVPPRAPWDSKLSMAFANEGLGGPAFPGYYRRDALPMVEQGLALEAWVKLGPSNLDGLANGIVAYNGDPEADGFGLFVHGGEYVAKVGAFERSLGPAEEGVWHHVAYVHALGTSSYFYDGELVGTSAGDPVPKAATGGFWVGGMLDRVDNDPPQPVFFDAYTFNGWVDEVRYQTFNPLAAGAFDPTAFLIGPAVPEPGAAVLALAALVVLRRRRLDLVR